MHIFPNIRYSPVLPHSSLKKYQKEVPCSSSSNYFLIPTFLSTYPKLLPTKWQHSQFVLVGSQLAFPHTPSTITTSPSLPNSLPKFIPPIFLPGLLLPPTSPWHTQYSITLDKPHLIFYHVSCLVPKLLLIVHQMGLWTTKKFGPRSFPKTCMRVISKEMSWC